VNRRTFLKSGASATALLLSPPAWCAQSPAPEPSDADILAQTAARIEQCRKGDGVIVALTAEGKPVPGAKVAIEQLRHDFLFGAHLFLWGRISPPPLEEAFRQRFAALFNYCTLGFYWAAYEPERGKPNYAYTDQVVEWTKAQGITAKGHPLVWDHPCASPPWLPADFKEFEGLSAGRVGDIVARYRGRINFWDVVNEATHLDRKANHSRMADWAASLGPVPYVAMHLKAARAANPQATLLVNDYRTDPAYSHILERLCEGGHCPFDAVGIQSHMHDGVWPLRKVWDVCDTYAKLGRPIHFTESTIVSGPRLGPGENWGQTTPEGEARQAEQTANFYTALFAHPAVQAITWWDFTDWATWQNAPAGWLRKDMSPKPVHDRLKALIKGRWWTRTEGRTDRQGRFATRGFYGQHRITVDYPGGQSAVREVHWEQGRPNQFEFRG
jgi:endo-1,4-beta-xylanase